MVKRGAGRAIILVEGLRDEIDDWRRFIGDSGDEHGER